MSLTLFFWSLLLVVTNGENFMQEQCINGSTPVKLMYLKHCTSSSMIHVIEEAIGRAITDCTRLTGSCTTNRDDTKTGLTVNCNGHHTCTETVDSPVDKCNSTNRSVRVRYQCIRDSLDMCSPVRLERTGSVYLHSPGFPDSVGVSGICSCSITGSQMTVMLFELDSGQTNLSSPVLIIYADNNQVWPLPGKLPTHVQYNTHIGSSEKSVTLSYAGVIGYPKQNAWIKITGDGVINVKCSGPITSVPASPTSPTESNTTGRNCIAGSVIGCGVLLIIVIALIVFCRLKIRQNVNVSLKCQGDTTIYADPIDNVTNPYGHVADAVYTQSSKSEGSESIQSSHVNIKQEIYNKIMFPNLRTRSGSGDWESVVNEQAYSHIHVQARQDTDSSSTNNGPVPDTDGFDDTYNRSFHPVLKDQKGKMNDINQTYDHVKASN